MRRLYILQHYYEDENWEEHGSYLGIFTTEKECTEEMEKVRISGRFPDKEGMKNVFNISMYFEDESHWVDGFVS